MNSHNTLEKAQTEIVMDHATDNFHAFLTGISEWLAPDNIISDKPRLIALATDASFYTKIPKLVIKVPSIHVMGRVLAMANRLNIALTFRAAGTSLSGQAITDSVLVMLTPDWQQYEVIDNGEAISLAPGIIGAKANRILAVYGRKIGPDPASINACKVGGIAANNASGMCCGVKNNSYHTLRHIHVLLPDGSEVNTADAQSVAAFEQSHSVLLASLAALRCTLLANTALTEKVRYQYRLKNTMGYGLNALLDYENPLDIFTHLMIGSEGTLGFIANITYNTVPLPSARETGLYLFEDFEAACAVIPALKACDVDAVELMDARALRAVAPLLDEVVVSKRNISNPDAVALLIDVGAPSQAELDSTLKTVRKILTQPTVGISKEYEHPAKQEHKQEHKQEQKQGQPLQDFTAEPNIIENLWSIRKGLFPAVGAVRPTGTTVIIEDVAFPLESLADGLNALVALFEKHDYHDGIIFGHALDGNVHFVFSQGFNTPNEINRYQAFMADISVLVTQRFAGSLKAEHGTGRNMAPFLTAQWGDEGVALMRALKDIIDPKGILNPGVILNDDPQAHITHLKPMPAVQDTVDACIECGFCEPQCPSLNYTLSPRQRIALKRRQTSLTEPAAVNEINEAFSHLAVDSCAATGLCASACPVGIDTGQWIKQIRGQRTRGPATKLVSDLAAKHTDKALSIARFSLNIGHKVKGVIGEKAFNSITGALHLPQLHSAVPQASQYNKNTSQYKNEPDFNATTHANEKSVIQAVVSLCEKANVEVVFSSAKDLCCGQPWDSEGEASTARNKLAAWTQEVYTLSEQGRWPVIIDNSACAYNVTSKNTNNSDFNKIEILEVSKYLLQYISPRVKVVKTDAPTMLHIGCSSTKLDSGVAINALTNLCTSNVIVPTDITCCGFAGTKGFTNPGLNQSALAPLASQVPEDCYRGVSNSATCAIGLSLHSGVVYSHIAVLLDEVSQPLF